MSGDSTDDTMNEAFTTYRGAPLQVGLTRSAPRLVYVHGRESHQYSAREVTLWVDATEARRLANHLVELADRLESG